MATTEMPTATGLDWSIFLKTSIYVWNKHRIASDFNNISDTAVFDNPDLLLITAELVNSIWITAQHNTNHVVTLLYSLHSVWYYLCI